MRKRFEKGDDRGKGGDVRGGEREEDVRAAVVGSCRREIETTSTVLRPRLTV